jgi:hypothetical protein
MTRLSRPSPACVAVALAAALGGHAAAGAAPAAPAGRIVQAGQCDAGSTKETYAQPDATAGYASRGNVMIVRPGDTIPLHKGVGFGYLWHATGLPSTFDLKYRIQHPPITRKDGKRVEMFEETMAQASVDGEFETADCYFLDEDYEVVPGDWTITLLVQDKVLVTRTFHVVAEK